MTSDHAPVQGQQPQQGHADAGHHGPTTATYVKVAFLLTLITAVEVAIYYIPSIKHSAAFVPVLLALSGIKFFTVVAFYMHLKYDHRIFRGLFGGPFVIATGTIVALLFLLARSMARA
jgi:cytochrome c oxidase subunit IV